MLDLLKSLPDIVWFITAGYMFLLSLMVFILPFVVVSINRKQRKSLQTMMMIHEEMMELQDRIETLRKETTVSKLLAQDEQE